MGFFFSKLVGLIHLADLGVLKHFFKKNMIISSLFFFILSLVCSPDLFSCLVSPLTLKPPCVHSKRPRVSRQHAHMLFNMCAWCRHTRVRFAWTHGGQGGAIVTSAYQNFALVRSSLGPRGPPRNQWILPIFSMRTGREQHVADFSNSSLCLIKLFSFSNPEGHCGGNQL